MEIIFIVLTLLASLLKKARFSMQVKLNFTLS